MKALLLAAGTGSRLRPLTENKPKALVNVNGTTLIEHVLSFLAKGNFAEIGIITGYRGKQIKEHLKGKSNLTFFHNKDFSKGNIFTLKTAAQFLDDDILLLNIDHIYPAAMLLHILKNKKPGINAICDFDRQLASDDMKISQNKDKQLAAISKQLTEYNGGYIGMTFCDKDNIAKYRQTIDQVIEQFGEQGVVEQILAILSNSGEKINIVNASGFTWHEVDNQEDLAKAEAALH